jgi:putative SOS response-associated peptidase YedK
MRIGGAKVDRVTALALRTLEDGAAQGEVGTVDRTWGHKLALEWLITVGVAQQWQTRQFWEAMAAPMRYTTMSPGEHDVRSTLLNGALDNWHYAAGIERADYLRRCLWARSYAPELIDSVLDPMNHLIMCNRATPGDREKIVNLFDIKKVRIFNEGPRIVHPREPAPVVRLDHGELTLEQMTWGFPVVLKGKRGEPLKPKPVNNARFDKLKGFWRRWASEPKHRCLIPTARYAEAVGKPGSMTTTWLSLKSTPVFAWAGLWAISDEWGPVYTSVMTDNAPELVDIHDRSPVILAPGDWQTWLSAPLDDLYRFDRPWPADDVRVDPTVVSWRNGGDMSAYT